MAEETLSEPFTGEELDRIERECCVSGMGTAFLPREELRALIAQARRAPLGGEGEALEQAEARRVELFRFLLNECGLMVTPFEELDAVRRLAARASSQPVQVGLSCGCSSAGVCLKKADCPLKPTPPAPAQVGEGELLSRAVELLEMDDDADLVGSCTWAWLKEAKDVLAAAPPHPRGKIERVLAQISFDPKNLIERHGGYKLNLQAIETVAGCIETALSTPSEGGMGARSSSRATSASPAVQPAPRDLEGEP